MTEHLGLIRRLAQLERWLARGWILIMSTLPVERIVPEDLEPSWRLLTEHLERYEFASSRLLRGDVVVDAACGVGYGAAMLAKRASRVWAIDSSADALAYGRKHYGPDIEWIEADLDRTELPDCDVFISFETVEHLQDPDRFLTEARRVARRMVVMSAPLGVTTHLNEFHRHDFVRGDIERLMEPWHPGYFLIQSGSGSQLYGVWEFTPQPLPPAEAHALASLNLEHQRGQMSLQRAELTQEIEAWRHQAETRHPVANVLRLGLQRVRPLLSRRASRR